MKIKSRELTKLVKSLNYNIDKNLDTDLEMGLREAKRIVQDKMIEETRNLTVIKASTSGSFWKFKGVYEHLATMDVINTSSPELFEELRNHFSRDSDPIIVSLCMDPDEKTMAAIVDQFEHKINERRRAIFGIDGIVDWKNTILDITSFAMLANMAKDKDNELIDSMKPVVDYQVDGRVIDVYFSSDEFTKRDSELRGVIYYNADDDGVKVVRGGTPDGTTTPFVSLEVAKIRIDHHGLLGAKY